MSKTLFTPPTVLIAGGSGKRTCLHSIFDEAGLNVVAMDRAELDITSEASVKAAISAVEPNFVVNCARYPDVDRAESEGDSAYRLLVEGPCICDGLSQYRCHADPSVQ